MSQKITKNVKPSDAVPSKIREDITIWKFEYDVIKSYNTSEYGWIREVDHDYEFFFEKQSAINYAYKIYKVRMFHDIKSGDCNRAKTYVADTPEKSNIGDYFYLELGDKTTRSFRITITKRSISFKYADNGRFKGMGG